MFALCRSVHMTVNSAVSSWHESLALVCSTIFLIHFIYRLSLSHSVNLRPNATFTWALCSESPNTETPQLCIFFSTIPATVDIYTSHDGGAAGIASRSGRFLPRRLLTRRGSAGRQRNFRRNRGASDVVSVHLVGVRKARAL